MTVVNEDIPISRQELQLFQELVYKHAGIRMSDAKQALVQNRLRKRLRERECTSFAAYHRILTDPTQKDELQHCLEALTTNETFFFRHRQHWDLLGQEIVPEWLASHGAGSVFRFWSAASSTGEEPYSAAMLLDDCFRAGGGCRFSIEASDINNAVLDRARRGRYGTYSLQKLTPLCIDRYFSRDGEHFELKPELRRLVRFEQHNLMQPHRGDPCDVIFIRNVLIYFDGASKQQVISNVCQRLRPGGWLILGGAESLGHNHPVLEYLKPGIYRKATS